jgi:uncharacterized protein YjbI with pentapeptide repeats
MNRFAGKFSFYYNDYKLIFFDARVGLVHRSRTTFKTALGQEVNLPPEASLFLALERMDGWAVLQAFNGEIVSFGGENNSEILPTTLPTRNPRYPLHSYAAYFDLSLIRKARTDGTGKTHLTFKRPDCGFKGVSTLKARYRDPKDYDADGFDNIGLTNISIGDSKPETTWTIAQHADGVTEMTAGTKTVSRFDFRAAGRAQVDLSGEDLSGVNFGYADFTRAILKGTKLNAAKFERARFPGTSLDRADFTGATLKTVDFKTATMDGTILNGVTGESCDFSDCDLRTVVATTALAITSPEGAPTRYSRTKLKYALLGPDWKDRILDYAQVESIPASVSGLDARNADLTGMQLSKLDAFEAKFQNARLHAVGFTFSKLTSAKFDGARLEGISLPDGAALAPADFTQSELRSASFKNANVSGVSFSGAKLQESVFDGATVRGANFANAYMKAVNFSAVEQKMMHGVNFSRAFLVGCNFQGADLSIDVQLVQAYLQGADFSNAQLARANLAGSGIASEAGELSVRLGDRSITVKYDPTIIDPAVSTSDTTRCPNGDLGPCTGKLETPKPFPTSWPWPAGMAWPSEDEGSDAESH